VEGPLVRIVVYVLVIGLVLLICRQRRLARKETLGLYWPTPKQFLLFFTIFACLAALEEGTLYALNLNEVTRWDYDTASTIIRIIGICMVAPVAEEMIFRGLMFSQIAQTKFGVKGAIILPAVFFMLAHFDKNIEPGLGYVIFLQILVDGLFFGFVRHKTNSILLTIVLHAIGNSAAVIQRMV